MEEYRVVDRADQGWAAPTGVDSIPNFARVYDYLLGGKDNYLVTALPRRRRLPLRQSCG
jgi:hypothetical protein